MYAEIYDNAGVAEIGYRNIVFVRKVRIDPAWSTIRASVLFYMPLAIPAAATINNVDLQLGFCSGVTNSYGDATATHFVGAGSNLGDWTFDGTVWYNALSIYPTKKVGAVKTVGTLIYNSVKAATSVASFFSVDLIKGAPNYDIRAFTRSTQNAATPPTKADFIGTMDDATPAFTYHTYHAAQTVAVDEATDGTLDCLAFYWNGNIPLRVLEYGLTVW